ncbi:SGNH/GDSL hydrolase family protein [Paenibacillus sp. TRM 82003]|nr:SGNH/GDSL hydrolase family protein [Paenibacillus sp. TRM 82003]
MLRKICLMITAISIFGGAHAMASPGPVNRALLESYYQNSGEVYDDTKTEGALEVLADQIDANYTDAQTITTSKIANGAITREKLNADAQANETINNVLIRSLEEEVDKGFKTLASFGGFAAALQMENTSLALQVLGDSTGNDTTDWVYLLSEYLSAEHPDWYVRYLLWSDTIQDYEVPVQLSNPSAGVVRIGGGSQTRYLPNSEIQHVGGDIDIRTKLKMPDWTPSSTVTPIARFFATAAERSWFFSIETDGKLSLTFTPDGSTLTTATSPNPVTFSNGDIGWIRVWLDVDNGSGGWTATFYQSTDGVNWTSLLSHVTSSGTTSLNDATGVYEIGGRTQNGQVLPSGAELYEVDIRNGNNGFSVAPRMPDLWFDRLNGASHSVSGAPTLTIVNGSHPGANLSYLNDSTRVKKMTPNYGQSVAILSDSHNEGAAIGGYFRGLYASFIDSVAARFPNVPIVATAQNPELNTISGYLQHAIRRQNIFEVARTKNIEVLDVYEAFMPDPSPYLSDGVHPNLAGSQLWRDVIIDALP